MIKKFISYYKPYIGLFTIDMLAALLIAICNLVYPTIVLNIINEYVLYELPTALILASAVHFLI